MSLVPAVPGSFGYGPRVRTRRARRGRLRRRSDRVGGDQDRADPQGLDLCRRTRLQPVAVRLGEYSGEVDQGFWSKLTGDSAGSAL